MPQTTPQVLHFLISTVLFAIYNLKHVIITIKMVVKEMSDWNKNKEECINKSNQ